MLEQNDSVVLLRYCAIASLLVREMLVEKNGEVADYNPLLNKMVSLDAEPVGRPFREAKC